MSYDNYIIGGVIFGALIILFLIALIFLNTLRMYNQQRSVSSQFDDKHRYINENKGNTMKNSKLIRDITKKLENSNSNTKYDIKNINENIESLKETDNRFEKVHSTWEEQFDTHNDIVHHNVDNNVIFEEL